MQVAIQKPGTTNRKQYKYDKVFGTESNQEQVYEDTKALIRSVLDGEPGLDMNFELLDADCDLPHIHADYDMW